MHIFIVIPAFNEEKRIGHVLAEVKKTKLPVVVVDDGSMDRTFEVAKRYKVTTLRHKVNLGKGAAMKTGAIAAFKKGADAVLFMDSDGQHSVNDIPKFVKQIKADQAEVYFGRRVIDKKVPAERFLGNKIASLLVFWLYGARVRDILCGFRAITQKAFKLIEWDSLGYEVETEMAIRVGKKNLKFLEIPVEMIYYDSTKGLTLTGGVGIIFEIIKWKLL